jgi:hypothetical protein
MSPSLKKRKKNGSAKRDRISKKNNLMLLAKIRQKEKSRRR